MIATGEVWIGSARDHHFWNGRGGEWLDLSWQQFPPGSVVRHHTLLDHTALGDSPATIERCALLLRRVRASGPLTHEAGARRSLPTTAAAPLNRTDKPQVP